MSPPTTTTALLAATILNLKTTENGRRTTLTKQDRFSFDTKQRAPVCKRFRDKICVCPKQGSCMRMHAIAEFSSLASGPKFDTNTDTMFTQWRRIRNRRFNILARGQKLIRTLFFGQWRGIPNRRFGQWSELLNPYCGAIATGQWISVIFRPVAPKPTRAFVLASGAEFSMHDLASGQTKLIGDSASGQKNPNPLFWPVAGFPAFRCPTGQWTRGIRPVAQKPTRAFFWPVAQNS